ncbi:MAG TPA: hypothetical protein VKT28_15265 [Puia sp.]|nr:hypothetical protein [Puia sp.]
MSDGIDIEFVREYYQKMTDQEITRVLTQDSKGLTSDALKIVKEEIARRNLDSEILSAVEAQQQVYTDAYKIYDPEACPVDEPTRLWLEKSFLVLLNIFGREHTVNRKVLTPERVDFPIRYDGSERSAFATLKIIANQMEVDAEKITLDFYDERLRQITHGTPGGLYWGKGENENFEISLARKKLDEPENMVATLAHEIAHIKLLGENRMEENDERLTDLTTIFFGLGIFNANAAFQTFSDARYYGWSQSGYLTQMEWGYALALFAHTRQESQPQWASHLCMNVKADFLQGQNFISNNERDIFQQQ